MRGFEGKIYGRAENTPELKVGRSGAYYAWVTVIVPQPPDRDGNFHNIQVAVTCFGKLAEKISQELVKGKEVYCRGVVAVRKWTSTTGYKNTRIEMIADAVTFSESEASEQ